MEVRRCTPANLNARHRFAQREMRRARTVLVMSGAASPRSANGVSHAHQQALFSSTASE